MNHFVTCYPVPGKKKSYDICEAFAHGCGGRLGDYRKFQPGPSFFYGVTPDMYALWRCASKFDFYYCDNSYFDDCRERYFRVTRNCLQLTGKIATPQSAERLNLLGLKFCGRCNGHRVVVVEQSAPFMELVGYRGGWLRHMMTTLREYTDREIIIRTWNRAKNVASQTLGGDLENARVLVTHMSAAANEAILAGVPVITTGPCAAECYSNTFGAIDNSLYFPSDEGRRMWAAALANNQWTLEEMRNGECWKALNEQRVV